MKQNKLRKKNKSWLHQLAEFFRPKPAYIPQEPGSMKMHEIEPGTMDLAVRMGINPDRYEEIVDIATRELKNNHEDCLKAFIVVSEQLRHPNELGTLGFVMGKYCEQRHGNPLNKLFSMIIPPRQNPEL